MRKWWFPKPRVKRWYVSKDTFLMSVFIWFSFFCYFFCRIWKPSYFRFFSGFAFTCIDMVRLPVRERKIAGQTTMLIDFLETRRSRCLKCNRSQHGPDDNWEYQEETLANWKGCISHSSWLYTVTVPPWSMFTHPKNRPTTAPIILPPKPPVPLLNAPTAALVAHFRFWSLSHRVKAKTFAILRMSATTGIKIVKKKKTSTNDRQPHKFKFENRN